MRPRPKGPEAKARGYEAEVMRPRLGPLQRLRGRGQRLRGRGWGHSRGYEAEARGYEARGYEAEAKILALRPVWPRGFNISE